MATLNGRTISASYTELLKTTDASGVTSALDTVQDGDATASALQISTAGVKSTGTLEATGDTTLGANLILGGATVGGIKDEDAMTSDSPTHLATQQSIKAYVDTNVTAQDLDFQGDSGGALAIDLDSESLTLAGGTGIDTVGSANTVTASIDSTVATLTGSQTLTNKTLTSPVIDTGVSGSAVLDSDSMSGASATTLATSESIKAYVDGQTHLELGTSSSTALAGDTTTISSGQASAITANTAKTGITSGQASAITANTAKTGITSGQASAIVANTAKTGITSGQASAIVANTAKTGITSGQTSAIVANTAKTGITSGQASAITANTAKVTNATHTGEVSGDTALTVADDVIDEANLKGVGTATNDHVLTADSTATGGMKWAASSGGGGAPEGTAVLSTGETGAAKFLREDGDGTSSWQVPSGGGTVTGTGTDNQIAVWNSSSGIEGDADLVFDGAKLSVIGNTTGSTVYANFGPTTIDANTREGGIQLQSSGGSADKTWGVWSDANPSALVFEYLGARATAFDAGTRAMTLTSAGDCGLGVSVPAAPVHFKSTDASEQLRLEGTGTNAAAKLNFVPQGTGNARIQVGGTDSLTLTGTGVGIGTSVPAFNGLHVVSPGNSTYVGIQSDSGSSAQLKLYNTAGAFGWITESDTMYAYDYNDGRQIITFDGAGDCGLGVSVPTSKLSIRASNDAASGGITLTGSDNVNEVVHIYSTTDLGIRQGRIDLSSGGSATVNLRADSGNSFINGGGNFGLGTSVPQLAKLDVVGAIGQSGAVWTTGARANSLVIDNNGGAARFHAVGADATTMGSFNFYTAETDGGALERLTISSAGLCGIGRTPTINSLEVEGAVSATTKGIFGGTSALYGSTAQLEMHRANNTYIAGFDTRTGAVNNGGFIRWFVKGGDGAYDMIGTVGATCTTTHATLPGGALVFKTAEAGSAEAEKMRLSETGRLGIGTTAPDYELDVAGDIGIDRYIYHNGDADTYLSFTNNNAALYAGGAGLFIDSGNVGIGTTAPTSTLHLSSISPVIKLEDTDATGTPQCEVSGAGGDLILRADKDDEKADSLIAFQVDGTERLRIDSSGNAGLGTSSPATPSGVNRYLHIADTNCGIVLDPSTGTSSWDIYANHNELRFNYAGVRILTADGSSGRVTVKKSSNSEFATTIVTSGSAIAIDLDDADNFNVTLNASAALSNPTNITVGQSGCIVITHGSTMTDISSWGDKWHFEGGTEPTLSTDAVVDNLVYFVASATSIHAVLLKNMS